MRFDSVCTLICIGYWEVGQIVFGRLVSIGCDL